MISRFYSSRFLSFNPTVLYKRSGPTDGIHFRSTCMQLLMPCQQSKESNNTADHRNNRYNTYAAVRHFRTVPWRQRKIAVRNRLRQAEKRYKKPGQIQAVSMPLSPQEMDNTMLVILSQMDHHGAQIEVLKRHVMTVDKVSYDEACLKYKEIAAKNRENMYLLSLPYQVGIIGALTTGFLSLPMVFHRGTAHWFNNNYVTCVIPEPHELETVLEIGAWSWNWMEPPLGTISFLLLSLQLARSNMQNIGAKPYTARVKQWRAERLAAAFPQYDASILIQYSNNTSLQESRHEIENA